MLVVLCDERLILSSPNTKPTNIFKKLRNENAMSLLENVTSKNCDPVLPASCDDDMLDTLALLDWRDGGPIDPSLDPLLL